MHPELVPINWGGPFKGVIGLLKRGLGVDIRQVSSWYDYENSMAVSINRGGPFWSVSLW